MTDKQVYIDKVKEKFPETSNKCRPAIAIFDTDKHLVLKGFVIGDVFFIDSNSFEIYLKKESTLINYLDEVDDE